MFPRLSKVSRDLLTDCADQFDLHKLVWLVGAMIFFGGALFGLVHTESFDAVAYATGLSTLMVAGSGLAILHNRWGRKPDRCTDA